MLLNRGGGGGRSYSCSSRPRHQGVLPISALFHAGDGWDKEFLASSAGTGRGVIGHIQHSVTELPGNIRTRVVADNPSVLIASPHEYVAGMIAAVASVFFLLAAQREKIYFVDVCCIHQTNRVLKTEGIRHIAGFVAMSSKLLVLWDEHYFTRLWCVYELAMFRAIHPNRPVAADDEAPMPCSGP